MLLQSQTLVLGAPGTGKTTRLIDRVRRGLREGIRPERVGFVTFTKAAAIEANVRAGSELGLGPDSLPHFRTIHSTCFKQLGLSRGDVLNRDHLAEFGDVVGESLTGEALDDLSSVRGGDLLLTIDNYARTTQTTLDRAWRAVDQEVDWFRLKRFVDAYKKFKEDRYLLDFTDMLERYVQDGRPLDVDLAIVDEGQDLSQLQWAAVERAFASAPELWVAGDDDQEIYKWSGAAGAYFRSLPYHREVLPISHRLPENIFRQGQEIIMRVANRFPKDVRPSRAGGLVEWIARPEELDFEKGTWLVLARTRYQLNELVALMRERGVMYSLRGNASVDLAYVRAIVAYEQLRKGWRIEGSEAVLAMRACGKKTEHLDETTTYTAQELQLDVGPIWHDALVRIPLDTREYYLACRRRGELLHEPPRVRIDTIHGAKGAEAQNVLLLTDLTYRVHRGLERDPDGEHRVFYVGATRASEALFLAAPTTAYGYKM